MLAGRPNHSNGNVNGSECTDEKIRLLCLEQDAYGLLHLQRYQNSMLLLVCAMKGILLRGGHFSANL